MMCSLHRSTSARRSRAPRDMTNLNYTATITGPKGRRASVATDIPIVDLPHTTPRGTMDRLPPGSFVPDIALDSDSDYESTSQRIWSDRDPHGSRNMLNQNINRSPRNSLVPGDYYSVSRSPRNGGRSPRNSLVPDQGLAPDIYSSRHSLNPETSMRNSPVQEIVHNHSPRNSIAPLTGSRTSLISENGNPMPGRSPRHSLVPSSSRSPRGSVTNIELVDRSPQRSPRGSIASECMNQSPRNSIAPYEQMNRSHVSIVRNDLHRGSIGPNDEEMRSPRRMINPNISNRTPRGSFDGLPERRLTKATLMAQDPRRASADQGMNDGKNFSPYRHKEVNQGSVKSDGSMVQVNLGCGPNVCEDSRRASSSVSQFSNDESRRLFTNGACVPKNTNESINVRVNTYGSVVFLLKDANLEAKNTCDFVLRALKVITRTRVATGCLVCLSTLPISMLIFGWKFYDACPLDPRISNYLVIGGTFGILFMTLTIYSQIRSRRPMSMTMQSQEQQIVSFMKVITVVLSFFLVYWFVMGNLWILKMKLPEQKPSMFDPNMHCEHHLYIFALVHLIIIYVIFVITLLMALVLASFRILDCPLPERYK